VSTRNEHFLLREMLLGFAASHLSLGVALLKLLIRVLLVDDFEQWRRFYCSTLQKHSEFKVIAEVSNGLEAVDQARQLQPDLILLDIGLPTLNGMEAARRIREVSAASKILFVREDRSADIVEEALSTGAGGYIVKSDAAAGLMPAVNAVLEGKRFVSASLSAYGLDTPSNQQTTDHPHSDVVTFTKPENFRITRHHEVGFYSVDRHFLDHVSRFIGIALKAGSAEIVITTEPHGRGQSAFRERILQRKVGTRTARERCSC
jgi:DNA-binding NarL/FixJ family response regulator